MRNSIKAEENGVTNGVSLESQTKKEVLLIMKKNSKVTIVELTSMLSLSRRTITRYIKELVSDGVIVRVGNNRSGEWVVCIKDDE